MAEPTNLLTRYALVRRMQKLLAEIEEYFEDAAKLGVSAHDADPDSQLRKIRNGLIASLENERRLGLVRMDEPEAGR